MTEGSPSARVGLALIAKNEADRLPNLLASITGCFDRVTLLDTGSTDDTVRIFTRWAKDEAKREEGFTWQTGHTGWHDDFARTRTESDNLLLYSNPTTDTALNLGGPTVQWKVWADCDDVIVGAENIKGMCAAADDGIVAFMVDYDYARDPDSGACLSYLRRERIVRAGHSEWIGRVHEAQVVTGGAIQLVDPGVLRYVHNKHVGAEHTEASNDRNIRILEKWLEDEPENPRVLGYLGVENALRGEHEKAVQFYHRYLALKTGWDDERAQVHSRLAISLSALGEFNAAIDTALEAFRVVPDWPDTPLRLSEAYLALGDNVKGEKWARLAMAMGAPDGTLLIVNPLDYTFLPKKLLAGALGAQGRVHEAIDLGMEALSIFPDPMLTAAMRDWQTTAKRERTADTFAMCAEQLIAHDEQLKALMLLERCVPVFATDHPRIVQLRSFLRERIDWAFSPVNYSIHYEVGGSKPEDMIADENVDPLCEFLPRTNYLLDHVVEQLGIVE